MKIEFSYWLVTMTLDSQCSEFLKQVTLCLWLEICTHFVVQIFNLAYSGCHCLLDCSSNWLTTPLADTLCCVWEGPAAVGLSRVQSLRALKTVSPCCWLARARLLF